MSQTATSREQAEDIALASELQAALLPSQCPDDCSHQVAAARNRMVSGVGGDFYDFIRINADQTVFLIGDVVGHGVRASLVMARVMGFLHSKFEILTRPAEAITMLNRMLLDLARRTGSVLPCSLFYAVLDAPTGMGFFINAGHPQPFIYDPDSSFSFEAGPRNLLLGVDDFTPVEGCHTFTPGQRLVLYTDGVTEALDRDDQQFGRARLREIIAATADQTPAECADAVFTGIDEFRRGREQVDDETIIVIDRI